MVNKAALFIGLRYARASKSNHFIAFVNLFSVAGISLGLAALIVVSSVMNGFEAQLKEKILGVIPHILTNGNQHDVEKILNSSPEGEKVKAYSTMIESEGVVQTSKGLKGVLFQGVSPEEGAQSSIISKHIIAGSELKILKGQYQVAIGRQLSYELDVSIGDKIRLFSASSSTFTPVGRLPSQRVFTVAAIFDIGSSIDSQVVLLHKSDLARLMRKKTEEVQQTRIFLKDAFDYLSVSHYLTANGMSVENWRFFSLLY